MFETTKQFGSDSCVMLCQPGWTWRSVMAVLIPPNGRGSKVQQRPTAITEEDAEMRLGRFVRMVSRRCAPVLLQVVNITQNPYITVYNWGHNPNMSGNSYG